MNEKDEIKDFKAVFTTPNRPTPICKLCEKEIEPLQTKNGEYFIMQPTVCFDCVDAEANKIQQQKIALRLKNIRKIAIARNLPERFANKVQDDDFTQEIHHLLLEKFIENKRSLLVAGVPESGKTHFVSWLFFQALKKYPLIPETDFYYTSLIEVDDNIKAAWERKETVEFETLKKCRVPYLFFQFGDILKEKKTRAQDEVSEWVDNLFFRIIEYRYNKELPTVWVTRLSGQQAMNMYDNASVTRIIEDSIVIKLADRKYRTKQSKKNESYDL